MHDKSSYAKRYDWTSEDGRYRHFYFFDVLEDTDTAVLASVIDCLARLGDISGLTAFMRGPLTIERGLKDFDGANYATVRFRIGIDLTSNVIERHGVQLFGFGRATA